MPERKMILLDGASGTELQKRGLKPGQKPELLNIENPQMIIDLHRDYVKAGSLVINTNTFSANAYKLKGTGYSVEEIISAAIANAKTAVAGTDAKVALDIGPIGQMLEPFGSLSFEDAYAMYAEMIRAGVKAGADQVTLETFTDLLDIKAALLAAKENSTLPVFASMSFEADGRTFMGCTIESMAHTLEGLGADAIGFNCSVGPDKVAGMIERLAKHTTLPILAKPNAGLPDPVDGHYDMDADSFFEAMKDCVSNGAVIIGGCCGTTPEYIRKIATLIETRNVPEPEKLSFVCTPSTPVTIDGVHMIGERINPTGKKRFQQALLENDFDYIIKCALDQQQAGASLLDVNVGYPGIDEETMLPEVVKRIQAVCSLPLMLDSSNFQALENALRIYNGKPAVNSVNGKQESLEALLPIVKKYGAAVVGLCLDEEGIAQNIEKRLEIADRIVEKATSLGIPKEDVWIDALTLTVSAQQDQAVNTLEAIEILHKQKGLQCVLGVSNISFGLPNRPLLTSTFLTAAMQAGLTLPIVNPNQQTIQDAVNAFRVLNGQDVNSQKYIETYADQKEVKAPATAENNLSLEACILSGREEGAAKATRTLLEHNSPLEIVENILIPALDIVGSRYEAKELYLPQLLSAAAAAQQAFGVLRDEMARTGAKTLNLGTIVMATVKGDIHDIGKNIVKTVLENYGYKIIDLGKDVDPDRIVKTVEENEIRLVGLSALMTTTLGAMEETTRKLLALPNPPKVMVGGAVVTPEYAKSIGAIYSKDANAGVAIAREVFHE